MKLKSDLGAALAQTAMAVDDKIQQLLPLPKDTNGSKHALVSAMRYTCLSGGKKIRPFLVLSTAELFSVSYNCALRVASALEMLHCYSLIHDDLPALDNADTRRGVASAHKKFDITTAILAGDALLTMAFEILSCESTHSDPAVRCALISALSKASGLNGLVGGQMMDMKEVELDIGGVTRLQRLKTGALFGFACEAGAILGKAPPNMCERLHTFAYNLGLAFQIIDDFLDVEGLTRDNMASPMRRDIDEKKPTFVSVLGLDRSKDQAKMLVQQAVNNLDQFGHEADGLRQLAWYLVDRQE